MIPQHTDLGLCPLCKGTGFKKESDFTKTDCICEDTVNKYFLHKLETTRAYFGQDYYTKVDYQDKSLLDKIIDHMAYGQVNYNGKPYTLHINSLHRLEPFYTLNDYKLSHYSFPPLEDPLFPLPRQR